MYIYTTKMTNLTHSKISTFALSKFAKKDENITRNKVKQTFEEIQKNSLRQFSGGESYEATDGDKHYVKPHFEIDAKWIDDTVDIKRRDEIILNAVAFIVGLFDADFEDVCILYDEKDSKCSLHFNLANTFTSMKELIKMKQCLNKKMKELYFDIDCVYCNGFTKFRNIYSHKKNGFTLIGKGLQKLAFPELNIHEHEDIDYLVYSMTADYMRHWRFQPDDNFVLLYPECADAVESFQEKLKTVEIAQPAEFEKCPPIGSIPLNGRHTDQGTALVPASASCENEFPKNVIDELIGVVLNSKSTEVHTHQNITTTAKGLVNSGFVQQAERLVMNCMNDKNKDMSLVWNDCLRNAKNTKRTAASLYYLAKKANIKQFNIICAKSGETELPPHIFNELFTLKHGATHQFNERYLPIEIVDIIKNNETVFLKSHLGTGKTTIMKKVIDKYPNSNILYFSPRIAFAKQVVSELYGFAFYGALGKDTDEKLKEKIVIQMESLWKVANIKYDIVIIDEVESCLKQLSCVDTMKLRILDNHKLFEKIVKNSKKVVCCDAFLSNKSIEVINMICGSAGRLRKTATIVNEYNPYSRKSIEMSNDEALSNQLMDDLKKDKRCVFVCGSKSKADAFVAQIRQTLPDKKIMFYYGNMDESKKDFTNVNELWADLDLLVYTPVITCGVNYDPKTPTFHRLYVYGTPHSACVRDVFQATLRIRNIIDNVMFYAISKTKNNRETFPVGFHENYEIIQRNKAFVNEKSVFQFEKVNDWVLWNYAHNKNEEGIKLEYYQPAFYDYLRLCGYSNTKYTNKKAKASVEGLRIAFDDVKPINGADYDIYQSKYYQLTEEQKNSMRLYNYQTHFNVNSDVWDILELNKHVVKNIPAEFNLNDSALFEQEAKKADKSIDIYAENTSLKICALKKLNNILGVSNSLAVKYTSAVVTEKAEELKQFIEDHKALYTLRKTRGDSYNTRYVNSVIQTIYEDWNGCAFDKKQGKTSAKDGAKRQKVYVYENTKSGDFILENMKKPKTRIVRKLESGTR